MAGPGGGARGGGFSGGSFGGSRGGFSGGGFSGGYRPRTVYNSYRPTHYRTGGGYGSQGCGCLIVPTFAILFFFIIVVAFLESFVVEDGSYNEADFQNYANENYYSYFDSSSAVEDNILLVFITNEEADGYHTVAWVGDNVDREINELFGEYSEYGYAIDNNINWDYFGYSLDTDYAQVISYMTDSVCNLELESNFITDSDRTELIPSKVENRTGIDVTEDIVNEALEDFTEKTGIPCILLIDYDHNVFGAEEESGGIVEILKDNASVIIVTVIVSMACVAALIVILNERKKKKKKNDPTEKCEEKGCDGKIDSNERPPWEFD